jgi:hypothetical protein
MPLSTVSLHSFPRLSTDADAHVDYPLTGLEIVPVAPGGEWVTNQKGSHKRLSQIRRVDKKYGFKSLYPRRMCRHPTSAGCPCPYYWHFTVEVEGKKGATHYDHIPYCRVLCWAYLRPHSPSAELPDDEWALQAATHHHKTHRVFWLGDRLVVKDDRTLGGFRPKRGHRTLR